MSSALLDTSVLIAEPSRLPDSTAISVVSIGELLAGVRLARTPASRSARQLRLTVLRRLFVPLLVDEFVAEQYGEILAAARKDGRATKATDLLILATAAATGRRLYTLDERQGELAAALGISCTAL